MSGLGIMVLTLLLLVSMATSHQDGGEKQATQRDAINVRRRSITRAGWINNFDEPVNFICPTGMFLNHINSEHNNRNEDRVWNFDCAPVPLEGSATNCRTTNYVNELDQTFAFQCAGEGFITGTESVHNNKAEDRRFKFQCCEVPGAIAHGCYFTTWANELDRPLDFTVPRGKMLRGVVSYHTNRGEDRRFKFEICDYEMV